MTIPIQEPPALIIEMMFPGERMSQVQRRISQFLRGGVGVVWLIDPEDQAVTVYRRVGHPEVLEGGEELTDDGTQPGFRSRASDFFRPDEAN